MRKYWEIVADHLSEAGWSLGWVSLVDAQGRTLFSVDAHRDNGKRFVVHSDEVLTAFLELEEEAREAVSCLVGTRSNRDIADTFIGWTFPVGAEQNAA